MLVRAVVSALAAAAAVWAAAPESDVVVLTTDSYDKFVAENPLSLIEFFAPWCPHCKQLAPEYEKAATELKGLASPIPIASVDCTTQNDLCERNGIQGFPTLKVFRSGSSSEYKGQRTAESIVSTMKKQQLPSVSTLTAANLKEFSTSDRVVIVGFFDKDAGAAKKVFEQVAEKMRDDFVFGAIGDAKAVKEYKLTSPAIALFKKFDEGLAVYSGEFTEAAVSKFVTDSSMPIMDEVGPDNYELYMKRGLPLAFFFYGDAEQRAQYGPLLESVAKDFVGKVSFVYLDASKFGGHAPNLALREEWPAFGIQDNNKKWPFDQDKELTKQAVHDFVAGVADGTLEPTLKSDPIPETQEGPVTVVVGKTFEKIVRDTNKDVFIELYAPWCGHCKKLAPTWDELARTIKAATDDAIVVAKMDATTNDLPPSVDFNLQGFPTLLLFKAGSNEIVSYSGDRSLKSLLDFVRANAVHADKLPESVEETPALKAEETPVLNADERDEL